MTPSDEDKGTRTSYLEEILSDAPLPLYDEETLLEMSRSKFRDVLMKLDLHVPKNLSTKRRAGSIKKILEIQGGTEE